jgi:hypothetical protein
MFLSPSSARLIGELGRKVAQTRPRARVAGEMGVEQYRSRLESVSD